MGFQTHYDGYCYICKHHAEYCCDSCLKYICEEHQKKRYAEHSEYKYFKLCPNCFKDPKAKIVDPKRTIANPQLFQG